MRSQLTNPSLFSAGCVLKAHLTFSSPCWGAGNKTEECTCLLGWPTSSLLLNYSRALKCSSVWPHATRVPLFAPHDSSLTEPPFMHERPRVCACVRAVRVCVCACCQTLMPMHAGVIYTDDTPHKASHLNVIHRDSNYGQRKKPNTSNADSTSLMFWCTQRPNLFQTALSWIQRTCQDKSSKLSHKHMITCNYTPLRPSYLSPIHVARVSTARSSTRRSAPLAAFADMLSRTWITNEAGTHIPSINVRLIRDKYNATHSCSLHTNKSNVLSSVLRNRVKWITHRRAISNLC